MTPADDLIAKRYKRIAEAVRASLEALNVKSSNKFWNLKKAQTDATLTVQRNTGYQSYQDCANIISNSKAGNCGEKGMAYGYWVTQNAHFAGGDRVYTVQLNPHWDHMWAVMCRANLVLNNTYELSDFGEIAIMLDGWSEDFYFPNMKKLDAIRLNVWRCQNPFQMWVRSKVYKLGQGPAKRIKVNGIVA